MSAAILTEGTVIVCPHGIPAKVTAGGSKLKVFGTTAAVEGDSASVAGCPFTVPGPKPQPCVKAEMTRTATKVKTGGKAVLLKNEADMCKTGDEITNGPANCAVPQPKVTAT